MISDHWGLDQLLSINKIYLIRPSLAGFWEHFHGVRSMVSSMVASGFSLVRR
jgi:hypothetical protein